MGPFFFNCISECYCSIVFVPLFWGVFANMLLLGWSLFRFLLWVVFWFIHLFNINIWCTSCNTPISLVLLGSSFDEWFFGPFVYYEVTLCSASMVFVHLFVVHPQEEWQWNSHITLWNGNEWKSVQERQKGDYGFCLSFFSFQQDVSFRLGENGWKFEEIIELDSGMTQELLWCCYLHYCIH